jgi:hypothetical protein
MHLPAVQQPMYQVRCNPEEIFQIMTKNFSLANKKKNYLKELI